MFYECTKTLSLCSWFGCFVNVIFYSDSQKFFVKINQRLSILLDPIGILKNYVFA